MQLEDYDVNQSEQSISENLKPPRRKKKLPEADTTDHVREKSPEPNHKSVNENELDDSSTKPVLINSDKKSDEGNNSPKSPSEKPKEEVKKEEKDDFE